MSRNLKNKITEVIGWYGVAAIIVAYFLSSFGFVNVSSYFYQILNLTGAVGIVVKSLSVKDFQPAVLNLIWAVVAFIAIWRLFFL